jgi:hypothetical protein
MEIDEIMRLRRLQEPTGVGILEARPRPPEVYTKDNGNGYITHTGLTSCKVSRLKQAARTLHTEMSHSSMGSVNCPRLENLLSLMKDPDTLRKL